MTMLPDWGGGILNEVKMFLGISGIILLLCLPWVMKVAFRFAKVFFQQLFRA